MDLSCCMQNSRFGVLQWLCSAVSEKYVYDNQSSFFASESIRALCKDRLLSVRSEQRNESFFARLNDVASIFCLLIFFSRNIPCQVRSKYIFDTKCISNTKTISAC